MGKQDSNGGSSGSPGWTCRTASAPPRSPLQKLAVPSREWRSRREIRFLRHRRRRLLGHPKLEKETSQERPVLGSLYKPDVSCEPSDHNRACRESSESFGRFRRYDAQNGVSINEINYILLTNR